MQIASLPPEVAIKEALVYGPAADAGVGFRVLGFGNGLTPET